VKIYAQHLMPFTALPEGWRSRSGPPAVTLPGGAYDPLAGRTLYERYMDELVLAEDVGLDGVYVAEQHQSAASVLPAPGIIASAVVQRTRRLEIAVGHALPLRGHPLRVAEEVAMLDVLSGGRVICGFTRGHGTDYHSLGENPAQSLERFTEAHDLILAAWSAEQPLWWRGKHFPVRHANPWPRPWRGTAPPIWVVGESDDDPIELAARGGHTYVSVGSTIADAERQLRRCRAAAGPGRGARVGWGVPVFVGETDAQAWEEAWPHLDAHFNVLGSPAHVVSPPNYASAAPAPRPLTAQDAAASGSAIVGSVDTVTERLRETGRTLGLDLLVALVHFGTLPGDLTSRNIRALGQQVKPRLGPGAAASA
jgi:alkanesulfonate monooxygenase SsuD/methylene tetrahydromethanopterin reductase-like flavin-dependent oxidoreductase (luciferase family)